MEEELKQYYASILGINKVERIFNKTYGRRIFFLRLKYLYFYRNLRKVNPEIKKDYGLKKIYKELKPSQKKITNFTEFDKEKSRHWYIYNYLLKDKYLI
jgi:hypothetical protein